MSVSRVTRPRLRYPRHPIWDLLRDEGRSQRWLARRAGYSASHVHNVAAGNNPASAVFRAKCAAVLGLPERELFHDGGASSASRSAQADGESNRAGSAVVGAVYAAAEPRSRRSA
jgi:transcriptional regulator with XRE-family HTH domain